MEALFIYIAKSSGLLILFYCAYYFLLRKETFFNSNRWFLLAGLVTSVALPFLVYTKIVWIDPAPISNLNLSQIYLPQMTEDKSFEIDWSYMTLAIYGIGFLVFLIKFALDFHSLYSVLKGKKAHQQADFKFIDVKENIAPFSYFEYIVYNSSLYSASELENIIEHEKVHSDQNHTIDVLISRIFCILFWFNPIIWFYKKAIVQNLEFIADSEAAKKISDKKAYQYTLLKITTHENCVAITNHFYQSLIKKRIVMLNKNQSKKRSSWKFYVIIPALTAFVLLFQVETVAQEKSHSNIEDINPDKIEAMDVYTISKNTTDVEIDQRVKTLKEKFDISTDISELKRNSKNEITSIQIDLKKGKEANKVKKSVITTGIEKIGIIVITEKDGTITFNFADAEPNIIDKKTEEKDIKIKIKNTQTSNINNDAKTNSTAITNISTNVNTNTSVNTDENTVRITTKTDAKPIIVINGHLARPDLEIKDIDPDIISSMSVLKGLIAQTKYGDVGNNTVIEIITKVKIGSNEHEELQEEIKSNKTWKAASYATNGANGVNVKTMEDKNVDIKKTVIIIDGKVSDYKTFEKIDPKEIKKNIRLDMKSLSEKEKKFIADKYGKEALGGLIEIQTTNYKPVYHGYNNSF
ncbi:MAG: M56 family metallopeptidase [Flavobacterium sp.]